MVKFLKMTTKIGKILANDKQESLVKSSFYIPACRKPGLEQFHKVILRDLPILD